MSFLADCNTQKKLWAYIHGNYYDKSHKFKGQYDPSLGKSISAIRDDYLSKLDDDNEDFKIALMDRQNGYWTKWEKYPGLTWGFKKVEYGKGHTELKAAIKLRKKIWEWMKEKGFESCVPAVSGNQRIHPRPPAYFEYQIKTAATTSGIRIIRNISKRLK